MSRARSWWSARSCSLPARVSDHRADRPFAARVERGARRDCAHELSRRARACAVMVKAARGTANGCRHARSSGDWTCSADPVRVSHRPRRRPRHQHTNGGRRRVVAWRTGHEHRATSPRPRRRITCCRSSTMSAGETRVTAISPPPRLPTRWASHPTSRHVVRDDALPIEVAQTVALLARPMRRRRGEEACSACMTDCTPASCASTSSFVLSQRDDDVALNKLIDVAQHDPNHDLRKRSMFWLGQSRNPRARNFIHDVLTR